MPKIAIALLMGVLTITSAARADEASKRAKIRELFALNGMQARLEQNKLAAAEQYHRMTAQMTSAIGLSPEQQRIATAYYDNINRLLDQAYDWKKIEPAYEEVYNKVYTEEEIEGVVAFYKSPIGRAYSAKNPDAVAGTIEVSNRFLQAITPQLKTLTDDLMTKLNAAPER